MKPRVGILALQGGYEAHQIALERAGAEAFLVRTAAELARAEALVLPGGESTTMLKLLKEENLFEQLKQYGATHPVFGTCAGVILMASEVNNPRQDCLGLLDLAVDRNAYGRQLDSRIVKLRPSAEFRWLVDSLESGIGNGNKSGAEELEAVFIRAPIIRRVGKGGEVLAEHDGNPVLVDFGRHLVATFHPELTTDARIHRAFLAKLKQ
jgi:pyridoxal 5'-phosphate synthase pdxT subunit